jgi:hypothetical protein
VTHGFVFLRSSLRRPSSCSPARPPPRHPPVLLAVSSSFTGWLHPLCPHPRGATAAPTISSIADGGQPSPTTLNHNIVTVTRSKPPPHATARTAPASATTSVSPPHLNPKLGHGEIRRKRVARRSLFHSKLI